MNAEEERKLFAELAKRGLKPEVRNATPLDPYAGTSPVSPSSPKPLTWADAGIDTGTTLGRGNPADRSAGPNIPPKQPGASAPSPTQQTGSNEPGSSITQLPGAIAQTPGQIVFAPNANKAVISASHDTPVLVKKPSEVFLSDNEPRSPGAGYPRFVLPEGDASSSDTTSGHTNQHPPYGRINPRTMMGADANPLSPGDSGIGSQVSQDRKSTRLNS